MLGALAEEVVRDGSSCFLTIETGCGCKAWVELSTVSVKASGNDAGAGTTLEDLDPTVTGFYAGEVSNPGRGGRPRRPPEEFVDGLAAAVDAIIF